MKNSSMLPDFPQKNHPTKLDTHIQFTPQQSIFKLQSLQLEQGISTNNASKSATLPLAVPGQEISILIDILDQMPRKMDR